MPALDYAETAENIALDGRIGKVDGALLTAGIVAYTAWSIWRSRREEAAKKEEEAERAAEQRRAAWLLQMHTCEAQCI